VAHVDPAGAIVSSSVTSPGLTPAERECLARVWASFAADACTDPGAPATELRFEVANGEVALGIQPLNPG
jgi:hypothetical protein